VFYLDWRSGTSTNATQVAVIFIGIAIPTAAAGFGLHKIDATRRRGQELEYNRDVLDIQARDEFPDVAPTPPAPPVFASTKGAAPSPDFSLND